MKAALVRDLGDAWGDVRSVADAAGGRGDEAIARRLAAFVAAGGAMPWAAYAPLNGVVAGAAVERTLPGDPLADWFLHGANGPVARAVATPRMVLSADAGAADASAPAIDVAFPVRDDAGEARGVL